MPSDTIDPTYAYLTHCVKELQLFNTQYDNLQMLDIICIILTIEPCDPATPATASGNPALLQLTKTLIINLSDFEKATNNTISTTTRNSTEYTDTGRHITLWHPKQTPSGNNISPALLKQNFLQHCNEITSTFSSRISTLSKPSRTGITAVQTTETSDHIKTTPITSPTTTTDLLNNSHDSATILHSPLSLSHYVYEQLFSMHALHTRMNADSPPPLTPRSVQHDEDLTDGTLTDEEHWSEDDENAREFADIFTFYMGDGHWDDNGGDMQWVPRNGP